MTTPGRGSVRVLRGSVLALCCAALSLSGHVAGGGRVTAALPLLVVAAPLAAAFVVWADRQRSLLEIGAAALGSQVAFLLVFQLCGASHGPPHSAGWNARMVAGHVVAATLLSWVLARGEAALWSLYRAVQDVRWLGMAPLPLVGIRTTRPGLVPTAPVRCGAGLVLASAHGRRGPPRVRAA